MAVELLKTQDVAEICGVSRTQVYDFYKRGLPYIRVGKRGRRVKRADLDTWIEQEKTTDFPTRDK